jgi:Tol biopolymer transport system component
MEHNDDEQRAHLDGYQPFGRPLTRDNGDASDTFVPAVLARLGLNATPLPPTMSEEQVVDALNSPVWQLRLTAVQQQEMLAEGAPLSVLLSALHDEHENVRVAAVRGLGEHASQASIEPLVHAMQDSAWTVRAAAALALGKLKKRTLMEPLVAALRDEDASVRTAAASALGSLGEQAALAPLAEALYDPEWTVREAAVIALGKFGTRVPAALLLPARRDRDESVRQAAELVLQQLYPEVLTSTFLNTTTAASENEADVEQHMRLNGHDEHYPKIIQSDSLPGSRLDAPTAPAKRSEARFKLSAKKRQKPLSRRSHFFPRLAAGIAAALVIIAAMFSWSAVPHGSHVISSSRPGAIATSGISTYRSAGGPVYRVAWSPDGTEIASTNAVGVVQVWNTVTGHTVSIYRGHFLKVLSLAWLSSQTLLVAAESAGRTVQVWNVLTGKRILMTPPLHGMASAATWSPDGTKIAFDGGDNTVQVWNIVTGRRLLTYKGHTARVTALSWSPDGTEIASASADRTVQVWNAATGQKDWPSFVHTDAVALVAWSPDDKRCAVATVNGSVEVWDNPSWQKAQIAPADEAWSDLNHPLIVSLAWSLDGARLAFTTIDGQIQVWDATTTHLLYTYAGHMGQVNNVAWSPDGTHIASANSDGTVQVWPVPYSIESGKLRSQ